MIVLGATTGIGLALGILFVIAGARRTLPAPAAPRTRRPRRDRFTLTQTEKVTVAIALGAGVVAALVAGWFIAVMLLPAIAWALPRMLRRPDPVSLDRLQAMEEWVRALHGILGASVPLTTAITKTLASTPDLLHPEVERLVARIGARRDLATSLYAFADELDDQTGDFIATSLIAASRTDGAGLSRSLDAIATQVADEVRRRRDIEIERARAFSQARYLTLGVIPGLALFVLFTDLGRAYHSPLGQLVLAALTISFLLALAWLKRRSITRAATRFLITPAGGAA